MNKLLLKKLKEGLKAELSDSAPRGKDNIQTHDITSVTQFNEVSILRDWTDENDDTISKYTRIKNCIHCGSSN